jgi:putative RecB family exonuclease
MPVYSHTQLSVFEECPQRYKFQYIDKVRKPGEQGAEAFVGSRVHEALQKLYEDLRYEKLNSMDELVAYYRDQWRRNWTSSIRIVREGLSEENYLEYGVRCIQNYYRRHQPFDGSQTLKTEFHLAFPLDLERRYKVQGYIDRVARRSDGVYEIHDYKTGGSLPSQACADSDRQLALYHIGLKSCWNDVERVDLIWHYVGLDSTLVSHRSLEDLDELSKRTIGLIDQIENCQDFQPVKSGLCDWCEYRMECPIWKHVVAIGQMPPREAAADEGVRLVNEYAAAKLELDWLTGRLGGLRRKLVEYARGRQAHVLQGNGVRVSITSREQTAFPDRGTDARRRMEDLVKSSGKWNEVSELSVSRLARVVRDREWPRTLLCEIEKFVRPELTTTIRMLRSDAQMIQDETPQTGEEGQETCDE